MEKRFKQVVPIYERNDLSHLAHGVFSGLAFVCGVVDHGAKVDVVESAQTNEAGGDSFPIGIDDLLHAEFVGVG